MYLIVARHDGVFRPADQFYFALLLSLFPYNKIKDMLDSHQNDYAQRLKRTVFVYFYFLELVKDNIIIKERNVCACAFILIGSYMTVESEKKPAKVL